MIKVGITGGIGSGKTIFCKEWEKLGAYIVYADDLAKELMHENEILKNNIRKIFGQDAYDGGGNLNREHLAKEAFEKGRVEELNKLVHPVLWQKIDELAEEKEAEGIPVFAKEAAILLNNGRPEGLDYVILIMADEQYRIKRTVKRDQSSVAKIKSRIQNQPDFGSLTHFADFVVVNNEDLQSLKRKAKAIYEEMLSLESAKRD